MDDLRIKMVPFRETPIAFRRLTLLGNSLMRIWIDNCNENTGFSVLASYKGQYAGWACAITNHASKPTVAVFVHPDFRRNGIGARLMKRIIRELRRRGYTGWRALPADEAGLRTFKAARAM